MKSSGGVVLIIVGLLLLYLVMSDKYVLLEDFVAGVLGGAKQEPAPSAPGQASGVSTDASDSLMRARELLTGARPPLASYRTPPFLG